MKPYTVVLSAEVLLLTFAVAMVIGRTLAIDYGILKVEIIPTSIFRMPWSMAIESPVTIAVVNARNMTSPDNTVTGFEMNGAEF